MNKHVALITLFVFSLFVHQSVGVFFYASEGVKKCFIEDLPGDTEVRVEIEASDILFRGENAIYTPRQDQTIPIGIIVEVHNSNNEVVLTDTLGAKGDVAFAATLPGEHIICVKSNSTRWFSQGTIKVEVEIETGLAGTNDYDEIKALEQLTDLEVAIRRLNDRVIDIRKEQAYFKNREAQLRNISEAANGNVLWFSVLQTAILVAGGLWQIQHLKGFFKAKKMV